jgi:phosphoribosylformylglycinamidine synthase
VLKNRSVKSIHDISKGGFAVALSEMCISGKKGAQLDLARLLRNDIRIDELLFSESHGRFIIEVDPVFSEEFISTIRTTGIKCEKIGMVGGDSIIFSYQQIGHSIDLKDLEKAWIESIPKIMGERQ